MTTIKRLPSYGLIDGYMMTVIKRHEFYAVYQGGRRSDAALVSRDEIAQLIRNLQSTLTLLDDLGKTQRQIREDRFWDDAKNLIPAIYWGPALENFKIKRPKGKRRYQRIPCVYSFSHPENSHLLKIGQTVDFGVRLKTHEYTLGHLEPIFLLPTQHHVRLEECLHRILSPYQIESEWFMQEPVLDWFNTELDNGHIKAGFDAEGLRIGAQS